jgi:hypothetical protein
MSKAFGRISPIKKDPTSEQNTGNSLLRAGRTRTPGAGVLKFPYKELSGKYRTGLDPDAGYIERIQDPEEKALEKERITKLKQKLEKIFGVDLGPFSNFWNHSLATDRTENQHVKPVKLGDKDNDFHFKDPIQELTFAWLKVHPTIASSFQAWRRGEYPAETAFYVVDEDVETKEAFSKKQLINKAITKFETMSPTRRRKVARQLGLPVTEETPEENVYVLVDTVLKQTEFKDGAHKGLNPVKVFLQFADMDSKLLDTKDLVKQSLVHNVLRTREGGKIFRGEFRLADNEESLVKFLMNDDNQQDYIQLEQDLKTKKLAAV